ncbi:MAG: response regulator [Bacteroidales bacterium]|nr:response regulator [Bacteroidales bacterium]
MYDLSNVLLEYYDKDGIYKIDDLKSIPFVPAYNEKITAGFSFNQSWSKFTIVNQTDSLTSLILAVQNYEINSIKFFELENDSIVKTKNAGEWVKFSQKKDFFRQHIFSFILKPSETRTIVINAHNNFEAITTQLSLSSQYYFVNQYINESNIQSLTLGILFILVLITFTLYFKIKLRVFLYASLYFFSGTLLIASIYGYLAQYIFSNYPIISDYSRLLFIYLTIFFSMLFFIEYVELKKFFPKANYLTFIKINIVIILLGIVTNFLDYPYRLFSLGLYLPVSAATILFFIYWSFKSIKLNPIPTKTIIYSIFPLLATILLILFRNIELLKISSVLIGFQYAFTLQITFVAFGLIELIRLHQNRLLDELKEVNKHNEHQKFILSQKNIELETLSIASSKTNNSIVIYSKEGNIKWYNEEFIHTYKSVMNQVFRKKLRNIINLIPNSDIEQLFENCKQTLKPVSFETMIENGEDTKKYYQTTLSPILSEDGTISNFVTIDSDITQIKEASIKNKELQTKLMQMEKLESIGKLAGGIAHDFNNLLTPIIGFSDLVLLDTGLSEESREDVGSIKVSATRAKKLVNQILVFSNYFKPDIKLISIKSIVNEVFTLQTHSKPTSVTLDVLFCDENPCMDADSTHIHQVVMNITKNAIQSIQSSTGKVTLSLEMVSEIKLSNNENTIIGNFAKISIVDNGIGMDAETQKKIFDPFFTTKKQNQGTGLGMSVVHGIVNKYNGYIDISSKKGEGTAISIYFPIKTTDVNKIIVDEFVDVPKKEDISLFKGNHQHIMIVDDEEEILKMMKKLLDTNGYTVSAYSDSVKALEQFTQKPKAFDLIITDQTMPNLNGEALCKAVFKLNQNQKIMLMTGYSEEINSEQAHNLGIKSFLLKPLNADEILKSIKIVLE